MRVAIPTQNPGGLEAERSDHFGHCEIFTVVDLDETNTVTGVETVANGSHEAGGCMVPVQILHDAKVEAIVVGGMGARPMRGFAEVGIKVYFANRETISTVSAVIAGLIANQLPVMHVDQVCKGSGDCHH
ncbi:MAG: NifB/NifX family molybdenum-iron cluster-binding protein [Desulfoprunum sp.]|nr:NifB/NifX family molybdenum-iron cluster-binding protein [Desulfoprunum sp.]